MPAEGRRRSAFWPTVWLAAAVFATKLLYWPTPELCSHALFDYARDVAASTEADLLFAVGLGLVAEIALLLLARRPRPARAVFLALVVFGAVSVLYAVASTRIFTFLRSPLTYPLIYISGDMRSMRSSIGSFLSPGLAAAMLGAPVLYVLSVLVAERHFPLKRTNRTRLALGASALGLLAYVGFGRSVVAGPWSDRDDHLIAQNPHLVLVTSSVRELLGFGWSHDFVADFPASYLDDFESAGSRPPRVQIARATQLPPRNLVFVVLESTATRYLSLYGSRYVSTPRLEAESRQAVVFDNFYSHVGMTANSLVAMSLSIYPYMTWREFTVEDPDLPGVTLAELLSARGYRTAFIHSGDLDYVDQRQFLTARGFELVQDYRRLGAKSLLTSWGVEEHFLADGVLRFIDAHAKEPFYVLAWTSQTHHPYEPGPDVPPLDFFNGNLPPDDYDLGRYLNTVHEVDRQLGRIFDGLRERGLDRDTLVVVTGDHGEAFGDPHPTWGHGGRLYQENLNVPLMVWNPRLYPSGGRSATVGGHVDLNPTIAELLGIPGATSWQGWSLFDPKHPPRAYFYAASSDYMLGVREGSWKYVYSATRGAEELFDLSRDPDEQTDLSQKHPEKCRELRLRLAAWRHHTERHLARLRSATPVRVRG